MIIDVSVLIITRNRSFIIGDCLKALEPQINSHRHEVVIVDSSEKEDTEKIVSSFKWVRYYRIQLPLGTRPQSYSYGAKLCQGKVVALLDDDAIVFPNWLNQIENAYQDQSVGAAGGRILGKVDRPETAHDDTIPIGLVTRRGRFFSNFYIDSKQIIEVDSLRGCNMSVRKDLLDQMHYFDERFRGQNCRVEDDICFWVKRMGFKILFDPKCIVRHLAEERPDIPRSEYSMRSEFYVWRNTVWLFAKHSGLTFNTWFNLGIREPFITCFRRVLGGGFKQPKLTRDGLRYLPAALAGVAGGIWGIFMSVIYCLQSAGNSPERKTVPYIDHRNICFLGDSFKGRS